MVNATFSGILSESSPNLLKDVLIVDEAVLRNLFGSHYGSMVVDAYKDFIAATVEFSLFVVVYNDDGDVNGVAHAMSDLKYAAIYIGANPLFEEAKECELRLLNRTFNGDDMKRLTVTLDATAKHVNEQLELMSERQLNVLN